MRSAALRVAMAAMLAPACTTLNRAGQDALVVGTYPVHAVTTPVLRTVVDVSRDGASPWASPLIFGGHLFEDTGVTLISAVDLGVSPALGVADLASEDKRSLRPLGMYTFDGVPPDFHAGRTHEVESDVWFGTKCAAGIALCLGYLYAQGMAQGTAAR